MKKRFHLPALPGRPVLRSNSSCAYTGKVRRFATMMSDRGHEVFVYGGGGFDGRATEFVECYATEEAPPFEAEAWRGANLAAAAAIDARREEGDFLGIIGGLAQRAIADLLPEMWAVEYGVGYAGVFAPYRVFESYAWMHVVHGAESDSPMYDAPRWFDAVIPNYFDLEDFPVRTEKDDYLLYCGRLTEKKGLEVVEQAARAADRPLFVAGPGDRELNYGEKVGEVGPEDRGELMAGAAALLVPTLYAEPFGGVAVEAMMCGTPVISTDWGAFTETVRQGVDGFRCRTLGEFIWAIDAADRLDRAAIAERARATYSTEAIAPRYESYFDRVALLSEHGWFSDWEGLSQSVPERSTLPLDA
ncbi:MAG: glycosyltransferase [Solirubrobacterales bacterium]